MTDEEIDAMEPGREMDAEVQRTVYHRCNVRLNPFSGYRDWYYCEGGHDKNQPCEWLLVPHYSTKIAAAWEVVEKMREQGFHRVLLELETGTWRCDFQPWTGRHKQHAETMPLAICRAALKCFKEP